MVASPVSFTSHAPATHETKRSAHLAQDVKTRLPSPPSEESPSNKRKHQEGEEESYHLAVQPTHKVRRFRDAPKRLASPIAEVSASYGSSIHWEEYFDRWPLPVKMDGSLAKKRSRTPSTSYTESVRGGAPRQWSRQHEEKMQKAGLFMTDYQGRATITDECKKLCQELCHKEYSTPAGPSFQLHRLGKLLELIRFRNESRVFRDVTSLLVPSAELLHIDNVAPLVDLREALNAEWTQCDTLCGPRPKPDFVVGVADSAFTDEEKETLQLSHTSASPNLFPESMYYPFLICEVKGDRAIAEAERQAMHSSSIALRALIQLYRKISAVEELDGKILVFSITHDPYMVKIFGHFAKIEGDKLRFFRHQVYVSDIATDLRAETASRAHKITRAIYDIFFPQHLARITNALSKLRGSMVASFPPHLDLDTDSQVPISGQSSQNDGQFKRPSLPSNASLQQENKRLREQYLEAMRVQQKEQDTQRATAERQLTQQMEQQKAESQEQRGMLEKQMEQQRGMLEKQMEQQKAESREQRGMLEKQMEQQKAESREQRGMLEKQMEQQKAESREQRGMLEKQIALLQGLLGSRAVEES